MYICTYVCHMWTILPKIKDKKSKKEKYKRGIRNRAVIARQMSNLIRSG